MGLGNGIGLPSANAGMLSVRPELAGTASGLGGAITIGGGAGLAALAGAALSVLLIMLMAGPRGGALALILAGAAISSLAGAGISLALNLAPNPYAAYEIMTWLMGSLADRSAPEVQLAAPFILAGCGLLYHG